MRVNQDGKYIVKTFPFVSFMTKNIGIAAFVPHTLCLKAMTQHYYASYAALGMTCVRVCVFAWRS
jgi:hypothetical protein